jgi:hypothetical protein
MEISLESLGITKEDLQEKVIERLCERLLSETGFDEDGNPEPRESSFHRSIQEKVKTHVSGVIGAIAEASVYPNVTKYIEDMCLQETTKWGEKVGKPVSFLEYLVARADAYIREEVDYNGKDKKEGGYNWSARTTRIVHLINSHLHYNIERAMTEALGLAVKSVKESLEGAVKLALEQVKVTVKADVKS